MMCKFSLLNNRQIPLSDGQIKTWILDRTVFPVKDLQVGVHIKQEASKLYEITVEQNKHSFML